MLKSPFNTLKKLGNPTCMSTLNHSADKSRQTISQNQVLTTARLQMKAALIAGEYQNYEQAIKELTEALSTCTYSFSQSSQMLETITGIHTLLGINYNLLNQKSEAIQAFEQALNQISDKPTPQLENWHNRALENLLQTCHALSLKMTKTPQLAHYLEKASTYYLNHRYESLQLHEQGLKIQLLLVEHYLKKNQTTKAIELLKSTLAQTFPLQKSQQLLQLIVDSHLQSGNLLFQQKSFTEALNIFDRGLKYLSKASLLKQQLLIEMKFKVWIGQSQYQLKQYNKAPFWFKLALEDYKKIASPSKECIQLQIKACEFWINSLCYEAINHYEKQEFQAAIKLLLKGLKLCQLSHPSSSKTLQTQQLLQSNLILNYLKLGTQILEEKEYKKAIKVLSKVNQLTISYQLDSLTQGYLKTSQEKLALAYYGQGLLEFQDSHFETSILLLKKSLNISIDHSLSRDCLLFLARNFLHLSQENMAIKCLNRFYPEPTCTLVLALEYSLIYLEKEQPQMALNILVKAAQDPRANVEWLAKIRLAIANIYMSQKSYQQALNYLNPIIKVPPKLTLATLTQVQFLIGQCYLELKNYQAARQILIHGFRLLKSSQSANLNSFTHLLKEVHLQSIQQWTKQQDDEKIVDFIQSNQELNSIQTLEIGVASALRLSRQSDETTQRAFYFELIEHWLNLIKQASLTPQAQ